MIKALVIFYLFSLVALGDSWILNGIGLTEPSPGFHAPYRIPAAGTVTVNAAHGWWQSLTTTGATVILIADKVDGLAASVRLDLWTAHATTITNLENFAALNISTAKVNVLLFDNAFGRGPTNWFVSQIYP